MRKNTGGRGPPRSGRQTKVSIAPSAVAMSTSSSLISRPPPVTARNLRPKCSGRCAMIGIRSSRVSPAISRRHAAVERMDNEVGRLELIRESLVAVVNEMRANVHPFVVLVDHLRGSRLLLRAGGGRRAAHRPGRRRQPHPQLRGAVLGGGGGARVRRRHPRGRHLLPQRPLHRRHAPQRRADALPRVPRRGASRCSPPPAATGETSAA